MSSWNKNNPQNIFAMFYQYHKNYPFFLLQPFLHQSKENTITKFNVWSKIIPSWMNPKNTSFVWWCSITRQSISPMWWGVTWLQITSKFMAKIQYHLNFLFPFHKSWIFIRVYNLLIYKTPNRLICSTFCASTKSFWNI